MRAFAFDPPSHARGEGQGGVSADNGIQVDYFELSPGNVSRETLEKLTPKASGVVAEIKMDVPQLGRRDAFALRFSGQLYAEKPGQYTFFIASDDGSRLYIDDELLINHDGLHGMSEKQASVQLTAGMHALMVTYFDNGGGDGLAVQWSGPGIKKQALPADRLMISGSETVQDLAIRTLQSIPGHEAEKFRDLVALLKAGRNRNSAISALRAIDRKHWNKRQARAVVDNLVAFLSDMPARYRTGAAALEAMALASEMSELLPPEQASSVQERLKNLDIRVIAIGTVPERMIYDKERIAVRAGETVEFRFSNTDAMPHNLTVTLPGAMEEIGLLAEATARDPDAMARQFVPESDKILMSSRLLQPGESQGISFEAP
ncbi:MAG: hypothetical protein KDA42_20010, partial [Planctomycetales bacterium]|nr:hypothetical protein [Planctomycetales bacterium]